jgi:hypothetical protein
MCQFIDEIVDIFFFIDFVYFVVVFIGNYQQKYFVTFFHQQLPIKYFSQHY